MIYLIASESNQLINEEIEKINKNYDNILYIDYNNSSIDEILAEASYYSMFNDKKLLIIKNANFFASDKINEENSNRLLNYFKEPNELTTIVFTTNGKVDMRKKITKELKEKYNFIQIANLKSRDIFSRIKTIFNTEGYIIDEETINYIISNNANNYDLIYNELTKIMLYYQKPCKVKYEDVINIVARSLDTNNFKFVDMIVAKNISEAFKLYDDIKLMKIEPLSLIGLLAREYRLMLFVKILKQDHYSNYEICDELKLQDWQLEKFIRNSMKYKIDELEERMIDLANLDLNIKSGKIDKWVGLAKFIFSVFLKFNLAISLSISLPRSLTKDTPTSSTIFPAPFGKVLLTLSDSSWILDKNTYLLIIDATATLKHLSSALVVKVIFFTFSGALAICSKYFLG